MQAEKGAATVEFAMFAMFLILLVAGIVDLGRGLYTAIALDEAVQEGAMFAAFTEDLAGTPVTGADIETRVITSTSSPQLTADDVAVTCVSQARSKQSASRVTVQVSHTVDLITPFISDWFGGTLTLEREAVVDRFFAACPDGTTT
ncbi:MAG: TadE family protein [Acidimicrobiia bacterium]